MPICKHCQAETTQNPADEPTCPVCGMPFEVSESDQLPLESDTLDERDRAAPEESVDGDSDTGSGSDVGSDTDDFSSEEWLLSSDEPSAESGGVTMGYESVSIESTEAPSDFAPADADGKGDESDDDEGDEGTKDEDDFEVERTLAFGRILGDDDDDEVFDFALEGEEADADPESDPPAEPPAAQGLPGQNYAATLGFSPEVDEATLDSQGGIEIPGAADSGAGEDTHTFGDESGSPSPESSQPPSGRIERTIQFDSDPDFDDSDSPSSQAADDGSSYEFDSDGSGSGPSDSSRDPESRTIAFDSGDYDESDKIQTPESREITGLSSGQTSPRVDMGIRRGSESLKPGDSYEADSEDVRLRRQSLSELGGEGAGGDDQQEGRDDHATADYELIENVGEGGMGVIWSARQRSLDRKAAVKRIKKSDRTSESDRNKFISEAVITGQLEHPNIVPVHDMGLAADGLPFYSMKLLQGDEWERVIRKLSEEENLEVLLQVAQAIAFAHSRGIIHRDLKPGNVWVGEFNEVLVLDWGLAARLETVDELMASGTPVYMPPETALKYLDWMKRARTDAAESETRRLPEGTYSDIYLLGGLLFKIVTGRAPHRGKSPFECVKNAARNRITKVKHRGELIDIAFKALQTDPSDRHRTVQEFIDELKAYQQHAQSVQIARTATKTLKAVEEELQEKSLPATETYARFAAAQHGFMNALDLWPENRRAKRRLVHTQRQYAETAYANGDFDLSLSLLDTEQESDAELITTVKKSQADRDRRVRLFRRLQYGVAASLALALTFIGASIYLGFDAINKAKEIADAKDDLEQVKLEAQTKVSQAKTEALSAIEEGKAEAKRIAEEAQANADKKVEEAEAIARIEITKAKESVKDIKKKAADDRAEAEAKLSAADSRVEEAEKKIDVLNELANESKYAAAVAQVRADFALRGQYAASQTFNKSATDKDISDFFDGDPPAEWKTLEADVDWSDEAEELAIGLKMPPEEEAGRGPRVAAARDGSRVAVASEVDGGGHRLVLLGSEGQTLAETALSHACEQLAMSGDGRFVGVVGDGRLSLFDAEQKRMLSPAKPPADETGEPRKRAFTHAAFHPSEPRLLTADRGTWVDEWVIAPATGGVRWLRGEDLWHSDPVTAVGYSPSGKTRYSADTSGRIEVWQEDDVQRWHYRHSEVADGSPKITCVALAEPGEGSKLVYGCQDGAVYVLDIAWNASVEEPAAGATGDSNGWVRQPPNRLAQLHSKAVASVGFVEEGQIVVSTGADEQFVRSANRGQQLGLKPIRRYHDQPLLGCDVAPLAAGGPVAFNADQSGRIVRWRVQVSRELTAKPAAVGRAGGAITALEFDPPTGALVAADAAGFVRHWSNALEPVATPPRLLAVGHKDHNRMRAWSLPGSGGGLATLAADNRVCVWNGETGHLIRALAVGPRPVAALGAAGDEILVASSTLPSPSKGDALAGSAAVAAPLDGSPPRPLWDGQPRVSAMRAFFRSGEDEQTIAVGLRDGQVFLWKASQGWLDDLERSSARPHWRPIKAFAYDRDRDTLYVGDNEGLVTRWPLQQGPGASHEAFMPEEGMPVRRLQLNGATLLAVQETLTGTAASLLDPATLATRTDQPTIPAGVLDLSIDQTGQRLYAIAGRSQLLHWTARDQRWRPASGALVSELLGGRGERLRRVECLPGGRILAYGPGVAKILSHRQPTTGSSAVELAAIRSRPVAAAVDGIASPGRLVAITRRGRLDAWRGTAGKGPGTLSQASLENPQRVLLSAAGPTPGTVLLANRAEPESVSIEIWDTATQRRKKQIGIVTAEAVHLLAANPSAKVTCAAVAVNGEQRLVVLGPRGRESVLELGADEPPISLALDGSGRQAVVVWGSGKASYAAKKGDQGWAVKPLIMPAVTAVAFSSDGSRLISGDANGQVQMHRVEEAGARASAVTVLELEKHSNGVSVVDYTTSPAGDYVVSGDTSGEIVLRRL